MKYVNLLGILVCLAHFSCSTRSAVPQDPSVNQPAAETPPVTDPLPPISTEDRGPTYCAPVANVGGLTPPAWFSQLDPSESCHLKSAVAESKVNWNGALTETQESVSYVVTTVQNGWRKGERFVSTDGGDTVVSEIIIVGNSDILLSHWKSNGDGNTQIIVDHRIGAAKGELVVERFNDNSEVEYRWSFDANGRPKSREATTNSPDLAIPHGGLPSKISWAYGEDGRLVEAVFAATGRATERVHWDYDSAGNPWRRQYWRNELLAATVTWEWDPQGRLLSRQWQQQGDLPANMCFSFEPLKGFDQYEPHFTIDICSDPLGMWANAQGPALSLTEHHDCRPLPAARVLAGPELRAVDLLPHVPSEAKGTVGAYGSLTQPPAPTPSIAVSIANPQQTSLATTTLSTFRDRGELLTEALISADGTKTLASWSLSYDNEDLTKRTIVVDGDAVTTEYEYDAEHRLISALRYGTAAPDSRSEARWTYEGNRLVNASLMTLSQEATFHSTAKCQSNGSCQVSAQNHWGGPTSFTFSDVLNADGIRTIESKDEVEPALRKWRFDKDLRLLEDSHSATSKGHRYEYQYDSQGNVSETEIYTWQPTWSDWKKTTFVLSCDDSAN